MIRVSIKPGAVHSSAALADTWTLECPGPTHRLAEEEIARSVRL